MPSSSPSSRAGARSLLGGRPGDTALVCAGRSVDYAELARLVAARRAELGPDRRLVMIEARNALEPVVTYLAALEGGHPVLLVTDADDEAGAAQRASMLERFDPDVVARHDGGGWRLEERRPGSRHELHPELALLASTSGSTGSPKLVRLSAGNLRSNAAAIAEYLRIGPADRAATTLPLQYCYGLSVLNSHLLAGASVVLTERSVSEEAFWDEVDAHGVTSFAGVPYTFELLEASGFADRRAPSLRYLTQAGGRLDPARVRRFARLGAKRGFELFVMYGQTEATARMAYLPPELAERAAGAIGRPIPGGRFRIDAEDGAEAAPGETGELVYLGPNVMLGYAESPADFALGRTVHELRTGDLARLREDGLYEITGRMSRFVKVFGLRIDLDRVERLLSDEGIVARAASRDDRLLLFANSERTALRARERAAALLGIPALAIGAYAVAEFPRTSNGKPDTQALVRHADLVDRAEAAAQATEPGAGAGAAAAGVSPEAIRDLFAILLGRPEATVDDSFAALGGDSLSYIEVSLRLETMLGALPRDWPSMSARRLSALADRPASTDAPHAHEPAGARPGGTVAGATARLRRAGRPVGRRRAAGLPTPAVLRALAIVCVVGTHAGLLDVRGGAHLLLAVAGYNLARFQLAAPPGTSRSGRLLRSALQIAVPCVLWVGSVALVSGAYGPSTVFLVHRFAADNGQWGAQWHYWFLEAMVWLLAGLAALFAFRAVDRLERRRPFLFALALTVAALGLRLALAGPEAPYAARVSAEAVLWLVALGWLAARADTLRRRVLVSVVALLCVLGWAADPQRQAVVAVGIAALLWMPSVPLPRWAVPVVATLASASLFVYLTHWQVLLVPLPPGSSWLATLLSLAVGVVVWRAYATASARIARSRLRAAVAALARGSRRSTGADGRVESPAGAPADVRPRAGSEPDRRR